LGKALAFETKLPFAAVATTYSGSEMTTIWGLSDGTVKRTFRDAHVAPRLVLYDPDLTHDLPSPVSASSGMNAIAHCVEAEYAPESNPVVQWFASEGIRRVSRALPVISTNPGNNAARQDALLGAHFAGRALDMTSMGLHHKLAHILGGSFGMPHAESHAALLPWVTAWNGAGALDAMERIAAALGVEDAATGLADLSCRIGIKPLSELGFSRESIPRAVDLALGLSFPNPRKVEADGVRWILESALTGRRFQRDG
jgi:maleylacetate reductase